MIAAAKTDTAAIPTIRNSIGIKLVKIPAGEFMMGNLESIDQLRKDYPQYDDFDSSSKTNRLPTRSASPSRSTWAHMP